MPGNGHKPAQLSKPFRNRITGAGMERVDQLLANPANWRLHPDNQQQALAGAIDDIGFIRSVTVNKTTGCVLDGHLRVTLAARSGVDSLPVEYVELTEAEEAEALLTLDPIGALAAADKAKLDELMRSVNSDDARVQAMIAEIAKQNGLYQEPQGDDPGAQIDKAEELRQKWGVETGQLWRLGEHRLICGDCTDRAVVERVMDGEKAELLMADPPYNVKYTGGSTNEAERPDSYQDEMSDEDYTVWLTSLLGNGFDCSDDKTALLLWFASAKMRCVMDGFENAGWEARTLIVWNKTKAHYGALGAQYKHKYEPMWYCYKFGNSPRFFGATNETTVWDFEQPHVNDLHPTMKPIELYERCVSNHSERNNVVLELFSGSGTTLIACERLGRKCRAVEISPAYCAVAIERWVQMTGGTPELLEAG